MPMIDFSHIDLTVNLFTTPLFILLLGLVIKRWFKTYDDKQALKDENTAQWRITITNKLNTYCENNEKDHGYIWEKLNHHSHTPNGKVIDMT